MNIDRLEATLSFIRATGTAIANAGLYTLDHSQVDRLCNDAHDKLTDLLMWTQELVILVIDGELVIDGQPLGTALYLSRFAQCLTAQGMGNIKFIRGVTPEELKHVVDCLSRKRERAVEMRPSEHIRFGKVEVRFNTNNEEGTEEPGIRVPPIEDIPELEHDLFTSIYRDLKQGEKLSIAGISEIVYGFASALSQAGDSPMPLLVERPGEGRRFSHSSNVCILTLAQAKALKIDGPLLHDIGVASLLHDIGNFFLLEDLLEKNQPLNLAQNDLIKKHPARGAKLLMETPGVPRLAVVTAFEHHIGYDLCGYPEAPVGWKQNMCSLMVAISDTYDALWASMTNSGLPDTDRISAKILGMAGTRLDPVLTCNFVQMLRKDSYLSQ